MSQNATVAGHSAKGILTAILQYVFADVQPPDYLHIEKSKHERFEMYYVNIDIGYISFRVQLNKYNAFNTCMYCATMLSVKSIFLPFALANIDSVYKKMLFYNALDMIRNKYLKHVAFYNKNCHLTLYDCNIKDKLTAKYINVCNKIYDYDIYGAPMYTMMKPEYLDTVIDLSSILVLQITDNGDTINLFDHRYVPNAMIVYTKNYDGTKRLVRLHDDLMPYHDDICKLIQYRKSYKHLVAKYFSMSYVKCAINI